MTLKKSLRTSDILSQLIATDQCLHAADPRHEITVVTKIALEIVGIRQLVLAIIGLIEKNKTITEISVGSCKVLAIMVQWLIIT